MQELLYGTGRFFLCVIPAVLIACLARWRLKVPDELFRKLLHFLLLALYGVILFSFEHWHLAAIFAVLLAVIFYPALTLIGKIPAFSAFVNERKRGEFRQSLILAMCVMAVSITVCWGWLDDKLLVLACIYAWGVGDGFAALVGKRFGKHKFHFRFADPHKSMEGSAAMFLTSSAAVLAVLLVRGGLGFGSCLVIACAAAFVSTAAELCSTGGNDTIICPAAAMAAILPLVHLFGR